MTADSRTITGLIVPFNSAGNTNTGRTIFPPGSIRIPNDLSQVKLLNAHSSQGGYPVATLTAWSATDAGIYGTFDFPNTPTSDLAFVEASSIKDRFSVEVAPTRRNGPYVEDGVLKAVALVPYPAFTQAKVNK